MTYDMLTNRNPRRVVGNKTKQTNHHLRALAVHPITHRYRLRQARAALPPLLTSPSRPTLPELMARHIFQTRTTQASRRLARNLAAIRLSRRLPQRPSAESLAQRGVLPPECVFGSGGSGRGTPQSGRGAQETAGPGPGPLGGVVRMSPALVARKRAVERERLKDGLRRWVGAVWRGEVSQRGEGVRRDDESAGVGRVWRLRRFWERVGREGAGERMS